MFSYDGPVSCFVQLTDDSPGSRTAPISEHRFTVAMFKAIETRPFAPPLAACPVYSMAEKN